MRRSVLQLTLLFALARLVLALPGEQMLTAWFTSPPSPLASPLGEAETEAPPAIPLATASPLLPGNTGQDAQGASTDAGERATSPGLPAFLSTPSPLPWIAIGVVFFGGLAWVALALTRRFGAGRTP